MSRLLESLSREIADAVRALPPEETPPPADEPVALEDETVTSEKVEG
jgi:hypothetical protein